MNKGRYYVRDIQTGRLFLVEPIGKPRTAFGDSLDSFCSGSIREKESIINEQTCNNIGYSRNPMDYINKLLKRA
jgi:hypothetical protein